ncbi:hypothetical protein ACO0LG_05135 [Undibacterium sp. Ji42W]|uniref:hypothetical protein n=1 Tax=Undibacterium sp. Ji42W TaxID=3413039 RepID=UPI003BF3C3FC
MSEASFGSSHFLYCTNGNPFRGGYAWVAFFCLLFLATARKVSKRRRPPACNLKGCVQVFELQERKTNYESEVNIVRDMQRTPLDSSQKHAGMTFLRLLLDDYESSFVLDSRNLISNNAPKPQERTSPFPN